MRTVLIVEDEPLSRASAEISFRELGYSVIAAETGEDAIALAVATRDLHLLFSDVDLGMGVSGWHVAKQVRITHPTVGVVYCSGMACKDDHLEFGVDRSVLLLKPYETDHLILALQDTTDADQ